jgi:hypothetical protein
MSREWTDFTGDRLNCGSGSSIDNVFQNGGGSVSVRVNVFDDGQNDSGRIFDKDNPGWILWVGVNSGGDPDWRVNFAVRFTGADMRVRTFANALPNSQFAHIVAMYDAGAAFNPGVNPVMYIDNVAQSFTDIITPTGTVEDDSGNDLYMGNRSAANRSIGARMQDMRIYDRLLTRAEVTELFSGKTNTVLDGLVFWMPLEGDDDNFAFRDFSGNGNNGTEIGSIDPSPLSAQLFAG